MKTDLPRIILTPGEPAGIGPDLAILLAQRTLRCRLAVLADPRLLTQRARTLGFEVNLVAWQEQPHCAGSIAVVPENLRAPVQPGVAECANAKYVLAGLTRAVDACVEGRYDALVTGPVHKGVINNAGFPFSGHTEFLAQRTGATCPVMLLANESLRVALVTTHVPLTAVSRLLDAQRLEQVIRVLAADLERKLGVARPRIAVCGLNPHAGEAGHLGHEEEEIIEPVVRRLRAAGLRIAGPLPADTAFTPAQRQRCDVVLAMYHDQGLPVIKYAGFGKTVNITLGLPIIRTSVDHGTAFELAGSGNIDDGSLVTAVNQAIAMALRTRAPSPDLRQQAPA